MKTIITIQCTNSRNWTANYVGYKLDLAKEEMKYIANELGFKSIAHLLKDTFGKDAGEKTFEIDYTLPIKDIVVRHMMKYEGLPF